MGTFLCVHILQGEENGDDAVDNLLCPRHCFKYFISMLQVKKLNFRVTSVKLLTEIMLLVKGMATI